MTVKTASVAIIAICKYYSHGTTRKLREMGMRAEDNFAFLFEYRVAEEPI